ncbi:hypothetical protein, partial [Escherichia coli]|uniref:hypothetical protein n=1 Tax=Escherichia coli TaxID=562 RepID=UPI001F16C663
MDTIITWMGDRLLGWITNKSDLRQRAITGLTPAIYSTILYTEKLKRGEPNNPNEEEKLYRLWYEASSQVVVNRPGFPGECFICELRLPDHRFRWKHNKLFLLLPEEYGPAFPA